jgi:spore coat protein A
MGRERSVSRRSVLRAGTATAFAAASASVVAACGGQGAAAGPEQTGRVFPSEAKLPKPFTLPFRVPPVSKPVTVDGQLVHHLVGMRNEIEILPGYKTLMLTYGGVFPGPTIISRRGGNTKVDFYNRLGLPAVIHLHGGHNPPADDGFPTDLVMPEGQYGENNGLGGTSHQMSDDPQALVSHEWRRYEYPLDQPAAMLWYHDHRIDFTGPMVYHGLAGVHILRDDVEDDLPLPRDAREIPIVIQDKSFDGDGQLNYPSIDASLLGEPGVTNNYMDGFLGDVILVNGVPWPKLEVDAARYRLRFLNGSNVRRYTVRLDPPPPDGPAFVQIGSDDGLLEKPVEHDRLTIAAAERFDVVVDFGKYPVGTRITLQNDLGARTTSSIMQFVVARKATDDTRIPAALGEVIPLDTTGAVHRSFRFRRQRLDSNKRMGWAVNDLPFDIKKPIASPRAGSTEVWSFVGDVHHPVHLHLGHFKVLSRDGRPPRAGDAGWKDTVDMLPREHIQVAVRFPDIKGRYVMHCHNLEHEDMMMMAVFDTV